ncbi:UNVERIFIED_CONTAM: hypothetical protein BEN50_22590 [Euhalothece sp. KZN 001]|jgi:hypothetical protein
MSTVTIICSGCEYRAVFDRLGGARAALQAHQDQTGHEVRWRIEEMAAGVAVMGDQAGVCGRFG